MIRRRFIFPLAALLLGPNLANANDSSASERVATTNGVSIRVEFDKREYLLAEPLWFRCSLVNETTKSIVVPYAQASLNAFLFDITGSNGKKLQRLTFERSSIGPSGNSIDPHKRLVELIDLYDEYPIETPGDYRIEVRFKSDGAFVRIEREKIREAKGWSGAVVLDLGKISIVQPTNEEDIGALQALTPDQNVVPRHGTQKFPYLGAFTVERRKVVIEEFPNSRYVGYARYFEAKDNVRRFRRSSSLSFADEA